MQHLILLHGALGHSNDFEPYEPFLSQYFRVHKILFHGHGGSPIPAAGLNIALYVTQLQTYIADHQLENVHLFGYSMGGYVALAYALQPGNKAASILTLASKLEWDTATVAKETKMLDAATITAKVPQYALQLQQLHGPTQWEQLLTAIAALMLHLAAQPLLTTAGYNTLALPVQMMVGDKDAMVTLNETRAAVKSIPNATLAVLPDTKHPIDKVRLPLLTALMKDFWKL